MGKVYGYIRVLSAEQDVESEVITMHEMQVPDRDIFIDKQVNGESSSLQYEKLMKKLRDKDLLYMKSLDMLGDGYTEIGRQWRRLTKEKKVDVAVLDMPSLDTRRGRALIGDVVLSMLEYASDAEWMARKQKQSAGIERAKSRGVQFGRPELPMPGNFEMAYRMWRGKEIKGREAAELCQISTALFYRRANQRREMEKHVEGEE